MIIIFAAQIVDKMAYDDPYTNYQRLVDTIQFLEKNIDVHPNYYEQHIEHIKKYRDVLFETPEVNQEADVYLEYCIRQYEHTQQFDLPVYLEACKKLLGNISEFQLHDMLSALTL